MPTTIERRDCLVTEGVMLLITATKNDIAEKKSCSFNSSLNYIWNYHSFWNYMVKYPSFRYEIALDVENCLDTFTTQWLTEKFISEKVFYVLAFIHMKWQDWSLMGNIRRQLQSLFFIVFFSEILYPPVNACPLCHYYQVVNTYVWHLW